jgi:S1-C subfamily serine protease
MSGLFHAALRAAINANPAGLPSRCISVISGSVMHATPSHALYRHTRSCYSLSTLRSASRPHVSLWQQKRSAASTRALHFSAPVSPLSSDDIRTIASEPERYAKGAEILDSIVKVYTVHSRPNYFLPWQNHPKRESSGTGFVVRDGMILTNAHVVADQTYVAVKRHGSGMKYRAGKPKPHMLLHAATTWHHLLHCRA